MSKAKKRKKNTLKKFGQFIKTKLKQTFHKATGVTHFRWITKEDSRVRPLHAQIHGKVFPMSTGHPTEGYPGEPFGCRCVAKPVRRGLFSFASLFNEDGHEDGQY